MSTVVHLVYIHGFRGDETTFQSFPTDLQRYLTSNILSKHHHVTFKSSLYPTYKSVKPISYATRNFLEWLSTQPPDPVILMCHSMGGLLCAEALVLVTKPSRIIGMVAFDAPFLGMHPHVVVSGIASLFPNKDDRPTESQMNPDPQVKVVDKEVTDDWDNFKKNEHVHEGASRSHLSSPTPSRSRSPSPDVSFVDRALSFVNDHSNDPIVRWFRKHSDGPFAASKQWIVEHFQFGICMFDPSGLHERYTKLVAWKGGMWVNYWTQTVPRVKDQHLAQQQQIAENDLALLNSVLAEQTPINSPPNSSISEEEYWNVVQDAQKQKKGEAKKLKEKQKNHAARHFIVLPTGLGQVLGGGDKWEKVLIEGVEDEVAAHCGLFIRGQNLDYDGFVQRVGTKLISWCESLDVE